MLHDYADLLSTDERHEGKETLGHCVVCRLCNVNN